jgi:threonine dehydratase
MSDALPTFADVEAAARRIAPFAVRTPLLEAPALSERLGTRAFVKPEMLQKTGSFKFRGATYRISMIPENERKNGVVAFSSGNHAQGVAAAARMFGIPATIVMPADAPRAKLEGTRSFGATIITYDRRKEDREAIAANVVAESGATLVRPFDDAGIVAGQGTIGLEIAEDLNRLGLKNGIVTVPCGGGGISSGIALALSGAAPGMKVVAVEPEDYDGMTRSLRAGAREGAPGHAASIADSLMAPLPGVITFGVAKNYLKGALAISDPELERAVAHAFFKLKLVVEPGGSAGLAALLAGKVPVSGDAVVAVLTGGNVDFDVFARCLQSY